MSVVGKNIGHVRMDRPPSDHAMDCLASLLHHPDGKPCQEVNFTVRDKLLQFGYIKVRQAPSPYKSHARDRRVDCMFITDAGRDALDMRKKNAARA